MDTGPKNYEISYLLTPALPEGEVLMYVGKLTSLIEAEAGQIRHVEEPKKRKLAYPVKKEKNSYFGWTTFSISPEKIIILNTKLKSEQSFLRHLIVGEEMEERRMPTYQFSGRVPGRAERVRVAKVAETPEEKLDLEALDKRLEEILGK